MNSIMPLNIAIPYCLFSLFVYLHHRYALTLQRSPFPPRHGASLYFSTATAASGFFGAIALAVFFFLYGFRISWLGAIGLVLISMIISTLLTIFIQKSQIVFIIACILGFIVAPISGILAFQLLLSAT